MTTQRPVPQGAIPTNFILTPAQKAQNFPSGILPSGQNNFYDENQSPFNNNGLPINQTYPNQYFIPASALYPTFPPSVNPVQIDSKLSPLGLQNRFSSTAIYPNDSTVYQTSTLAVFNPYIHYYVSQNGPILIPYVSSFKIADPTNPYPNPQYSRTE